MDRLSSFVNNLSTVRTNDILFNQYSSTDNSVYSLATKTNLLCYLTEMYQRKPTTILVGEAPGHKGCRLTGVPFTSEDIIASDKYDFFSYDKSSKEALTLLNYSPQKESTATMMWNTFSALDFYPLLWNACPFHPFNKGNSKSNRRPTTDEVNTYGKKPFLELCDIFKIKQIVAVGKTAEHALNSFGIKDFHSLPHPSYGNKTAFVTGLTKLVGVRVT